MDTTQSLLNVRDALIALGAFISIVIFLALLICRELRYELAQHISLAWTNAKELVDLLYVVGRAIFKPEFWAILWKMIRRMLHGKVHEPLLRRYTTYRRWHAHPYHRHTHYSLASLAVVWLVGLIAGTLSISTPMTARATSQLWTTQSDWQGFGLTNTTATSSGELELTASSGTGTWQSVAGLPSLTSSLVAVSSTGSSNVWIAESAGMVHRWNGSSWTSWDVVAGYNIPANTLTDVLSFGTNDTWIITDLGLARHWDGNAWSVVIVQRSDLPLYTNLRSMWGAASNDIWVGALGAMFHWNGSAFSESVSPGSGIGEFESVHGLSANDVWAINQNGTEGSIWHYTGTNWHVHTAMIPHKPTDIGLESTSRGWITTTTAGVYYSYNGTSWSVVSSGTRVNSDVAVSGLNSAWMAGQAQSGDSMLRNAGYGWSVFESPDTTIVDIETSTDGAVAISANTLYNNAGTTTYPASGTGTITYTPFPGVSHDWTSATVNSTKPTNTTVLVEYSADGSAWQSDIANVPSSVSLYIRITLSTTDSSVTPSVNSLSVNYDTITTTVVAPSGASAVVFNSSDDTTPITWSSTGSAGADHIRLQYSTNSGGSWTDISGATSLPASMTSYNWNTPDITSNTVRIKVMLEDSANSELASDASDADFSLVYDTTAPTLSISINTSGSSSTTAYPGETITLTVTSSETLSTAPTATVGGLSTSCSGSGTNWSCTRTVSESDATGSQTIIVSGQDLAGNTGTANGTITIQHTEPPIVVAPQVPLAKPTNVKAFTGTSTITLTYSQPSGSDTIRIWRSTNSSETGTLLTTTNLNKYTDSSVTLGTTYYYHLATYRASEDRESEKATVSATPPADIGYGVAISPRVVSLKPGASTQLTATIYDAFGKQQSVPVTWSVDSRAGTINSSGLFTASQNTGDYREGVVATVNYQGIAGRGTVPVYVDSNSNRVAFVSLNQKVVTLKPGASFNFSLTPYNQNGAPLAIDASKVSWSTTVGSMSGSRLTAGSKNGTFDQAVTATYTDPSGQIWRVGATVTISGETPYLYQISLTGHQMIPVNSDYRYYSYAYDQFNSRLNTGEPTIFTINNDRAGKIDSIGRLHTGSEEGCFYWSIAASNTYNNHTGNARSGVITRPYTEQERANLDSRITLGWKQVKFNHKPGESYWFSGVVYNGWGQVKPHSILEFKLTNSLLGTITANGQYTAGTETGIFPSGLEVYIKDLSTGSQTLFGRYHIVISEEEARPNLLSTRSVKTGPESAVYTSINVYDQFGLSYTGSVVRQYSLGSSNSRIEQNGLIETGFPEDSRNVILGRINTGLATTAAAQGSILASAASAFTCTVGNTSNPPVGNSIDEDGNPIIFLGPDDTVQAGSLVDRAVETSSDKSSSASGNNQYVTLTDDVNVSGTNWPTKSAEWIEKLLVPLSTLAILSTIPTIAAGFLQVISQLLSRFAASLTNALQAFTAFRRPRPFGRVVDGRTGKPVVGATAQIFAADTRRVIDVRRTDNSGQYVFLIDSRQTAILSVIAANYKPYEKLVHGENVHRVVKLGVQLEYNEQGLKSRQIWHKIFKLLESSRTTLLVLGTTGWVTTVLNFVSPTLFFIGYYYLFAWLLEWYISHLPRPFGVVKDALTNEPLNQVVVRIINRRQKLIGTEITNARGQFRTLLPSGVYTFTYSKAGYETVNHFGAVLPKTTRSFRVDALMNRQSSIR